MDSIARDAFVKSFDPDKQAPKAEETTVLSLSIPVRVKDFFSTLQDRTNKDFGAELKSHIIDIICGCHEKTMKQANPEANCPLISGASETL